MVTSTAINPKYSWDKDKLLKETAEIGDKLKRKLNIPIAETYEDGSKFSKKVYYNPRSTLITERDSR